MFNLVKYIKEKLHPYSQQSSVNQSIDEDILEKTDEEIDEGIYSWEDLPDMTDTSNMSRDKNYLESLKVIKTARGIDAINDAVDEGYRALIQEVVPSEKIRVRDVLIRNKETGKFVSMQYSYHAITYGTAENREIVMEATYYPYQFPLPFAAYLLPNDLKKGERVILDDIIEDIVGEHHSGAVYRQDRAEAIWNGKEFKIDHRSFNVSVSIG